MKITKMSDMRGGWFIGDFEPSVLRTSLFEVAVHHHKAGEPHGSHVHKVSVEYNYLISGKMRLNGIEISAGDIFVLEEGEPADNITFLEDCLLVVVKTPSIPSDKYPLENT